MQDSMPPAAVGVTQVVLHVAEAVRRVCDLSHVLHVLQAKYREALAAGLDAGDAADASFGLVRTTLQLGVPCMCNRLGVPCMCNRLGVPCMCNRLGVPCMCNRLGVPCMSNRLGVPCMCNRLGVPCMCNRLGVPCMCNQQCRRCTPPWLLQPCRSCSGFCVSLKGVK
jgi:hypothetical protein